MKRFSYASIVAATLLGAGLMTVSVRAQDENCEDRITSGGWIVIPEVGTANFGASGGLHKGEFWGQLNYVDKEDAGIHVRAKDVVGYCRCPGRDECRRITYSPAWVDGVEVDFVYVEVCDTGEPGVGDTFGICIPAIGYCREGVLGGDDKPSGGNIQLHKQTGTCGEAIEVCTGPPIGCECFEQCN
jgi:hypothetical protein